MRILIFSALLAFISSAQGADKSIHTIYGGDERVLVDHHLPREVQLRTRALAALFKADSVTVEGPRLWMNAVSLGQYRNLCPNERFFRLPTPSECTGFLISPTRVATAGHCIYQEMGCKDMVWAFDFREGNYIWHNGRVILNAADTYRCKKILSRHNNWRTDFAVVELDRPVRGRAPLRLSSHNKVKPGDPVYALGFPSGLPMIWSAYGQVRSQEGLKTVVHIDLNEGSSGSPVFDGKSHDVIGILTEGESDWKLNEDLGCHESVRCATGGCTGETILSAEVLFKFVPRIQGQ